MLLGASNIAVGLPALVDLIARRSAGPFELLVAAGAGRCYGGPGRFLGRTLPAISDCGLWQVVDDTPGPRTRALISDVGNDLMSGRSPIEITRRVEVCLSRLSRIGSDVLMTSLPVESLLRLGPWRFLFFRSLLFPGRRLSLAQVQDRVRELNDRLAELAESHGARLVRPSRDGYGSDGIHIRRRARRRVWGEIVSTWGTAPEPAVPDGPSPRPPRLAPERSTLFGRERRRSQPVWKRSDGSTISFY